MTTQLLETDRLVNNGRNNFQTDRYSAVDASSGYVEFMRDSVPCPTCRGQGKIPKEQEGELVALIPLKDKRLKPRRTYRYVCLAVFLCLLSAGLLLFFLCPRDVSVYSSSPYLLPHNLQINVTEEFVKFFIINRVNISNDNYFSVSITGVDMTILYNTKVINTVSNKTVLRLSMRSQNLYYIQSNVTFNKKNGLAFLTSRCNSTVKWIQDLIMSFQLTVYYNYFGHEEQTTLSTFQYVNCGTPSFDPIISSPATLKHT